MKTQYYTASSLDGFIADRQHSLDWLTQFHGRPGPIDGFPAFLRDVGAIAMGSSTYEWILRHHVFRDPARPQPWPNEQPTWVFTSRTLPTAPGAEIRFARGDVGLVHAQMVAEARGKNIWLVGGGDLVGQFYDHRLLDEIIVNVAPITLGGGAPLLPRTITTPPLRLISATPYGDTFVQLRYEVLQSPGAGTRLA
jgi:dihydrofolate reductase